MSPLLKKNRTKACNNLLFKYSLISALSAAGIMFFVFLITGNSLFIADRTVLRMDLYHQYGPLYAELYDRITSGSSLVYSWTSGLGGSFLGNLFNYCSSPFAVLMFIMGHKNMPEAIALMFAFKAALSAGSFTYYVNKSNREIKKESIAFGLMYAFSAYFIAYSWNIMWLDAVAVFPLVMLGIENIINKNKPGLYVIAMTYTMITNYYMAYMVCILSVMYFLVYYFGRYELTSKIFSDKKKNEESESIAVTENTNASSYEIDGFVQINDTDEELTETVSSDAFTSELLSDDIDNAVVEVINSEDDSVVEKTVAPSDNDSFISEEIIVSDPAVTEPAAGSDAVNSVEASTGKKKVKKLPSERRYLLKNKRFWVTGCTFAFSSFLCFCLAAFALVPIYYCLQSSSATSGTFPTDPKQYFDIFTFIANHLPGVEITIRSSGDNVIPNVYCGLLAVILLPFYFFSNKIPGKQKVVSAGLLIACFCGFVLNYFNYILHGFHMPNDLPYRWSFAYSFFLLIFAYKAYRHIGEFSKKAYVGAGFALMVLVVLIQREDIPNCKDITLILTVIFTILYVAIFGMMHSPRYRKNAIVGLLFFTIILEIVVVSSSSMVMQQSKKSYTSDYKAYQVISDKIEEQDEELFYRTELSKLRARMDPSWYGYNGASTFSSMAYEHTAKLMRKLGMFGNNINSYTYFPQTPVFNSMFSIKYIYDNKNLLNDTAYYKYLDKEEPFEAYEYEYYLPLLFSVDDGVADWFYADSDPFNVQNNLMSSATGVEDIFIPVDAMNITVENLNDIDVSSVNNSVSFNVSKVTKGSDGKAVVSFTPEEAGNYYVYIGTNKNANLVVNAGDLSYSNNSASISSFILDLGYLDVDDTAEVSYSVLSSADSANLTFSAARIDDAKFKEAYDTIINNGIYEMDSFDETSFSGKINVKNDNAMLWTSIPYDESWEITVDGKVLEYDVTAEKDGETVIVKDGEIVKVGNGLIGIEVEPGEHTVSFKYKAKGLSTGIKLTVLGVAVLIACIVHYNIRKKKNNKYSIGPFYLREIEFCAE